MHRVRASAALQCGPPWVKGSVQSRKIAEHSMAGHTIPHFHNSEGYGTIEIGAREFKCIGAMPPQDHPHVYLDMGDKNEIVCPYCSTHYRYSSALDPADTRPEGCRVADGDL